MRSTYIIEGGWAGNADCADLIMKRYPRVQGLRSLEKGDEGSSSGREGKFGLEGIDVLGVGLAF